MDTTVRPPFATPHLCLWLTICLPLLCVHFGPTADARPHQIPAAATRAAKPVRSSQADLSDSYYRLDRVLAVDIKLSPTDWDSLRTQSRTLADILGGEDCLDGPADDIFSWFRATVTVDGETHTEVAVRKKGFLGSLSTEKPSLKLRFDKFVDDQFLGGILKRLTLNNAQQDPSMINTCLSYHIFSSAGLPAPRCNFAKLRVNGEDLGLYVQVESIKTRFLERNFTDSNGNLYEGTISDFRPKWRGTFEKKTNEDQRDWSDIDAVVDALQDPSPAGLDALSKIVDIDRFYTFWALEVLVGHVDGYAANRNNFYFYREPESRFIFVPWGTDQVFTTIDSPFDQFQSPPSVAAHGAIAHRLYRNEATRTVYVARLRELLDTVWDETKLLALSDKMAALVQEHTLEEMRGPAARDTERVRRFILGRRAEILADLDPHPPRWSWPLTAADICWPERGIFDISFEAKWGTLGSEKPLDEGRTTYTNYELGGANTAFVETGVTAGIDKDEPPNAKNTQATLNFVGLNKESNLDLLVVSLPLDRVVSGSSAGIEGLHLTLAPPYIFPKFDGFIGKGRIAFDQAGTELGSKLIGRVYGTLYGDRIDGKEGERDNEENSKNDGFNADKDLIINEVVAKGDPLDWLELYNNTPREIRLAEYVIADDLSDESKRVPFPNDMVIQPDEYLQIVLDKKAWPGFALGSDEEVGIWTRDGAQVDRVDWEDGQSPELHSLARIPDLTGRFQTVEIVTPRAPNQIRTAVLQEVEFVSTAFRLRGNWPNPFNATTIIGFELPRDMPLDITIHDVLGRRVRQLHPGETLNAGSHQTVWNGRDDQNRPVGSGIYVYRIRSGGIVIGTGRMTLIR